MENTNEKFSGWTISNSLGHFSFPEAKEKSFKDGLKLSTIKFEPNLRMMRLTKMEPMVDTQFRKSPSLPSSPSSFQEDIYSGKYFPSYVTLGRRSASNKLSSNLSNCKGKNEINGGAYADSMQTIHSILASLDLAKYKRRVSDQDMPHHLIKTVSNQQTQDHAFLESIQKHSVIYGLPPPPPPLALTLQKSNVTIGKDDETYSSDDNRTCENSTDNRNEFTSGPKSMNYKLKQLTEKLKSASAPPSPQYRLKLPEPNSAPPATTTIFFKEPLPPIDQMPYTFDDFENIKRSSDSNVSDWITKHPVTKFDTLPRMKQMSLKNNSPITINAKRYDVKDNVKDDVKDNVTVIERESPGPTIGTIDVAKARKDNIERLKSSLPATMQKFGIFSLPSSPVSTMKRISSQNSRFNAENPDFCSSVKNSCLLSNVVNLDFRHSNFTFGKTMQSEIKQNNSFNFENNRCKKNSSLSGLTEKLLNGSQARRLLTTDSDNSSSGEKNDEFVAEKDFVLESSEEFSKTPSEDILKSQNLDYETMQTISTGAMQQLNPNFNESIIPSSMDDSEQLRPRAMSETTSSKDTSYQLRYSKKRLRGPYGEMLEQEMSKSASERRPSYADSKEFLKELDDIKPVRAPPRPYFRSTSHSFDGSPKHDSDASPKRKTSVVIPLVGKGRELDPSKSIITEKSLSEPHLPPEKKHFLQPTKCSPRPLMLDDAETVNMDNQDTRTHVVGELYETEMSYVESLQILVKKYMKPLKSSDQTGAIDCSHVDEIFYQIPEILNQHEAFLEVLKQRLANWDTKQKIGDVFIDVFTRQTVIDSYTAFINNWKFAKDAIKAASLAKPAFAKFLEQTSREHKGKLTLDALLIMPVQRIPRYELLIKELLKHTPVDHPDHRLLLQAQKEVHDLAVNINRVEREALEQEQALQKLRDLGHLIDGIVDLARCDRIYIRHDFVCIPGGLGIKKDRCLFLFSDLLLITNIKKKATAMRKTSLSLNPSTFPSLESNKYKLLMKLPLQNIEIIKKVDERNVKRFLKDVGYLETDVAVLGKIGDMLGTLSCQHQVLDDAVKEILSMVSKQLIDKQSTNSQLMALDLAVTMQNEEENLTVIFPNPEKRMAWEISFGEAKENLAIFSRRAQPPTFLHSIPIQKTRSGLQVTCAVSCEQNHPDKDPNVWICNSDGYVGQVCILSLQDDPTLTSCINVCSAKILCIICVPALRSSRLESRRRSTVLSHFTTVKLQKCTTDASKHFKSFQLDSDTSDDEDFIESAEDDDEDDDDDDDGGSFKHERGCSQPTIWLGTEDGCIYVYEGEDVRLKRTKLKFQHSAAIYDLIYLEGRIYVSLANGDIFVYSQDQVSGSWSNSPQNFSVGSSAAPVSKMLYAGGKLWCISLNNVLVVNFNELEVEHSFEVSADPNRVVVAMVSSSIGVWIAVQNSPIVRLFHLFSFHEIMDVNVAPAVTKMLNSCDDIIRQHKSACLRVSALHICKNTLWIGTSAGVLLTLPLPHTAATISASELLSAISGITQGHTGHVRMITSSTLAAQPLAGPSRVSEPSSRDDTPVEQLVTSVIVICAGDGYEDFSCLASSESAGQDDSTNHLLIWKV